MLDHELANRLHPTDQPGYEQDDPPDDQPAGGNKLPQYTAASIAAIGAFGMGTVVGWSATAVEMIREDIPRLTVSDVSLLGSIVNLGAAVVMLPLALLMKMCGRRTAMLAVAPAFFLSWLLLTFTQSVPGYIAGRFLTGMFGGVFSVAGPVYNGEIAEKEIRGALGTFFQLFLCAGVVAAYAVGYAGSLLALNLFAAAVPVVFFALMWLMPETPVYLLLIEEEDRAVRALQWLRGARHDVMTELEQLKHYLAEVKEMNVSLRKAFSTRAARRALIISSATMVIQQLSGIKPVVFYTVTIFRDAGSNLDPYVCTIITGAVLAAATGISTISVDWYGRRNLLLVSGALTTLCHLVIGVYFYLNAHSPESAEAINWLPLVGLCAYLITYTIGYGAVPWVLLGELFPPEIKEIAGPICASMNWLTAFVVSIIFPLAVSSIGSDASFWLLSLFCFLGFLFVLVFVFETKGKTLEEIQEQLEHTSYFSFNF